MISELRTPYHYTTTILNSNTTTLSIDYNYIGSSCIRRFYSLLTGACIVARLTADTTVSCLRTSPLCTTITLTVFLYYLLIHSLLI
jgi:hypothetical protein